MNPVRLYSWTNSIKTKMQKIYVLWTKSIKSKMQ